MADVLTFEEHRGPIRGRKIAWSGDYNNVLSSWIDAAQRFDFSLDIACPRSCSRRSRASTARWPPARKSLSREDPVEAVEGAAAVISDCWVSMGDEDEGRRQNLLAPYQVNSRLMSRAGRTPSSCTACPAHRGEEVTDEVIDGPQSVVFDEAENRLHAQKGILAWCLGVRAVTVSRARRLRPGGGRYRSALRGRVARARAAASSGSVPAIDPILNGHDYPEPVSRLVGEAVALAVLLGSTLKIEGRFQLQTKSDGAVNMLLVDFDAPSNLRALARFDRRGSRPPRQARTCSGEGISRSPSIRAAT